MNDIKSEDKINKIHLKDALGFGVLIIILLVILIIAFQVDKETFFILMIIASLIGIFIPIAAILSKVIEKYEIEVFINPMVLFAIAGIVGILASIFAMTEASQSGDIIWSIINLLFIVLIGSLLVIILFNEQKHPKYSKVEKTKEQEEEEKKQVKAWAKEQKERSKKEEQWAKEQSVDQIEKLEIDLSTKRMISVIITGATLVLTVIWLITYTNNIPIEDIYFEITQNPNFIILIATIFVGIVAIFMVDMDSKATVIASFGAQIFLLILSIISLVLMA